MLFRSDSVLRSIAKLGDMIHEVNKNFRMARISGDGFLIFDTSDNIKLILNDHERIENVILQNSDLLSHYKLRICYGQYFSELNELNVSNMIEKAILAHAYAKENNLENYIFNRDLKDHIKRDTELENRMHDALLNREFKVYLQPK